MPSRHSASRSGGWNRSSAPRCCTAAATACGSLQRGPCCCRAARDVLSAAGHAVAQTRQAAGLGQPRLRFVLPADLPECLAVQVTSRLRSAADAAQVAITWLETALDGEFSPIRQRRAHVSLGWLAARARIFDTGQGRKTDAADAHAIVMVALRDKGLREVSTDPDLAVLATVRPRDLAGRTRRRMAAEELADLHRLDAKLKTMKAEAFKTAVQATGSHLMNIHGMGPAGAARILADVGDVSRFPDRNHFASRTGTAPIDASSGQHLRQRARGCYIASPKASTAVTRSSSGPHRSWSAIRTSRSPSRRW